MVEERREWASDRAEWRNEWRSGRAGDGDGSGREG